MVLLRMGLMGAMVAMAISVVIFFLGEFAIILWSVLRDAWNTAVETGHTWIIWTILGILATGFLGGVLFPFIVPPATSASEGNTHEN
jgi:hypothetical protein